MGDSKKEIRIKSFQTQLLDDLIDQVNVWLSDKLDKTRNSFTFIHLKYYYRDSPSSDNDFQHSAIVIYQDSQDNFSKEKIEKSNATKYQDTLAGKKKLEYRK